MNRLSPFLSVVAAATMLTLAPIQTLAQQDLTWDQVKARFESANPALKADALSVDEARAAEITAHLRPNPQLTAAADGTQDDVGGQQ